ncbi:MAG: hypothetical protein QOI04_994 [Verrucomicrobiota bacterium]|jgi:hypothetical protein
MTWIEPPPQRGMGCFAKGCLTVFVFVIVLIVAFIGGGYLAFRHYRAFYFPPTPIVLPQSNVSDVEIQRVQERWAAFETSVRAKQPARIELTARQLNALISSEENVRDKLFVAIDNNSAHVQMSLPLDRMFWLLGGHYINAECNIEPAPNKDPVEAKITNIVVNNHALGTEVLTWRYRSRSVRSFLADWTQQHDVTTFDIVNDRVVLESRGGG